MDRQAEIIDRRRTMAAQEAWGKFSVRNANRLAELEAEERRANGQIDWGKRAFWVLGLSYCGLFWAYLFSLIRAMMNHQ